MVEDENNIPELISKLHELGQLACDVGIFANNEKETSSNGDEETGSDEGPNYVALAIIHEFGVKIKVTRKMRAYLHSQGLHLRKKTTTIKIPSRPFMRTGLDTFTEKRMDKVIEIAMEKLFDGSLTPTGVYERLGIAAQATIQEALQDMKEPQLHPFTIERKGSSQPLVDTGGLKQRITYMTVARGGEI